MTEMKITRAKPDDAKAIIDIKIQAWYNNYLNEAAGITKDIIDKRFSPERTKEVIVNRSQKIADEVNHNRRATFVAKSGNKVVGFTAPYIKEDRRRLGALYVSADMQGQGIGKQLLETALVWHGDNDVYLWVTDYNQGAIGLYKKYGFELTGNEIEFHYHPESGRPILPQVEMVRKTSKMET